MSGSGETSRPPPPPHPTSAPLAPAEFVEALVRVALAAYDWRPPVEQQATCSFSSSYSTPARRIWGERQLHQAVSSPACTSKATMAAAHSTQPPRRRSPAAGQHAAGNDPPAVDRPAFETIFVAKGSVWGLEPAHPKLPVATQGHMAEQVTSWLLPPVGILSTSLGRCR